MTGTAAHIAAVLGSAHRSGPWWRCLCPVHGSRTGTSATLALLDGERGLISVCHAGCSRADIHDELRRRGLLPRAIDHRPAAILTRGDARDDTARRIELARRIWDAARNARGTLVATYLAGRRITVVPPPTLRYAPALRHPSGVYLPAMVAAIVNVAGELTGVHRTYLRADGTGKADVEPTKAMLGRAAGGAVRLAPAAATLMVAEGIETAAAAMRATGWPAWAALSTSGMVALVLPAIVRTVIILADHDASGAGERAARAAASRWETEARHASIWMSPRVGEDVNDRLLAALAAEARDAA
jgi:putative DNA primase/helicase